MNISTQIGTEITSVNFGFYSTEDVENISVKQIVNSTVFDNLGHPTKGGLYDLALGPFLGKTSCGTCQLDERYCPGHFGHIVLPQPVYHPLLFKSMMGLLKATCVYCHHFRLKAVEVHRYACKLKLLSRGLVIESQVVDDVGKDVSTLLPGTDIDMKDQESDASDAEVDEDEAIIDRLIKKREKFVRAALHRAETVSYAKSKTSTAAEERKEVVKECLKMLAQRRRCENCGAISPPFKVEENAKVFEKSLSEKDAKYMAGRGMSRVDVNMDGIKKSLANGHTTQDVMIEMTSDVEDESGEDVMSDVEMPTKSNSKKPKAKKTQEYILSTAVRNHLRRLFNKEAAILGLLFNVSGGSSKPLTADNFFLSVIAVPPTRYRPPAREGDTIRESAQNTQLSKILNTCQRIAQLNIRREEEASKKSSDKYQYLHQQIDAFVQLQLDVNSLVDSTASMSLADRLSGRTLPPGIKQTLEKKEGLFRKHMMGKRVNYAARSVISPDPNIETNEIGIPPFIAQKLTFPEPVTPWNVEKLRHAVINGPGTYPGASHVEHDDGKITSLEFLSLERRTALANTLLTPDTQPRLTHGNSPLPTYLNKKVHRHLENDDILLVNRQPTLHKPSIMGHKAKVLTREKTIRLHYANCNTYNADFDGDEMNVHFPQNSLARAEAYNIANTDNQYLGPTNGNPLRGLIQDHISVAVWMTKRDTFFTRSEYQQLLYGSIQPEEGGCGGQEGRIVMATPTIMKPRPLWSGKQVISSILMNLTPTDRPGLFLNSESQVKVTNWNGARKYEKGDWRASEEQQVIFDNGELLCGILDKAQIGPSPYGMVHSVYEIYGPDVAGKLLSALGRLFTKYSQMQGLSCGMDDLRITEQGRETRKRVLKEKAGVGKQVATDYVGLTGEYDESLFKERMEEVIRDPEKLGGLDRAMQGAGSELTSAMYRELVPVHLIKKFPKNNMQNMTESKAKGGSDNANLISSIIGQQSLEGGRVPIMVSGKSLPSFPAFETDIRAGGYVTSCYLTGIKPQEYFFYCMAGREGLIDTAVKTSRSGYLQRCLVKHLEGITVQYDNSVREADGSLIQFMYGEDGLDVVKQKHLLDFKFSASNWRSFISKYEPKNAPEWLADKTAGRYAKKALKKPAKYDPVLSKFSPSTNLGSTSENFHTKLDSFIDGESEGKGLFTRKSDDLTSKKFRALMELKYLRSLIDPGEAVGVLAAQSIGEPSTQMTLNTFHLAGFGAGNVTMGVPRLREIIMTASRNIKTPNVTLTMGSDTTEDQAEQLAKKLSCVILAQLVDEIVVTEKVSKDHEEMSATKTYTVQLRFYPREEYEDEYAVTQEQVVFALSTQFLKDLAAKVKSTVKKTAGGRKKKVGEVEAAPKIGQGKRNTNVSDVVDERIPAHNNAEESDDDDNDYDHQKRERQAKDQAGYDGPDEDDRAIIRQQDEEEARDLDLQPEPGVRWRAEDEEKARDLDEILDAIDLNQMKHFNPNLLRFDFDKANGEWCEIELEYPLKMGKILMENIVEKVCQSCIVREIPGIKRCVKLPKKQETDPTTLMAEGRNIKGLWGLGDLADLNVLSSNDIGAIMDTYGVEAGRACIIAEISSIFGMYSIKVDLRHLILIADYMTFGGGYKPFNRLGLDTNVSPFLKMSFEQTCVFLTKATLEGDADRLETPSARLVMGRAVAGGTGAFDVLTKM